MDFKFDTHVPGDSPDRIPLNFFAFNILFFKKRSWWIYAITIISQYSITVGDGYRKNYLARIFPELDAGFNCE